MISNLQLLRAFCALAVVYYHTGNTLFGIHSELGGVAIFFCISGFIMAYIPQRSAREFFTDRVVRIAPVYWFATLAFFFWKIPVVHPHTSVLANHGHNACSI